MNPRESILPLAGLVASALALVPCLASAQDLRVLVVPFVGRRAGAAQRDVERVVRDRADLVEPREASRAARAAGVRGLDEEGVASLAAEVGATLVLQGTLGGSRGAPELTLRVRGPDGMALVRGQIPYRARRGRDELERAVASLLDRAQAARAPPAAPEPLAGPALAPVADPEPAGPDDGLAAFAIEVGLALRTRDADINLLGGGTRRYASGLYPELVVGLELRPMAHHAHLGRGVFLVGSFGHSLGLGSEELTTGARVPTNFVRAAFGAGWLASLGDVVELGFGLTFGYDGYHLAPNAVMPTAEYFTLRPGLRGRVRLAGETLVLDVDAGYRGVLGVGALATTFGDQAGAHGADVGVRLGGNLLKAAGLGFTWGLRFDWVGTFLDFGGAASDALGTRGSESALRFTALLGWSVR